MKSKITAHVVVIGAILIGGKALSSYEKKNYVATEAVIEKVSKDCSIQNSNRRLTHIDSDKTAYVDCSIAPLIAAKYGYQENAVSPRFRMEYSYISPADGSTQTDTATVRGRNKDFKRGDRYVVLAHKSKPSRSKWR